MTEDLLEDHFSQVTKESLLISTSSQFGENGKALEVLTHANNIAQLDTTQCTMYTAAVPVEFAENLPEGAVLQIMQDSLISSDNPSVETITLHSSSLKDGDMASSVETSVAVVNVPNYSVQVSDAANQMQNPIKFSEVAISDIDLSFLTESDEAATNNDEMQSIDDTPLENSPSVSATEKQYSDLEGAKSHSPDTDLSQSISSPQDHDAIVVDVSKPIQLSHNSLIIVDGQKCVLQQDPDTGQVVAYPVKEPDKPKKKRGRPKKMPMEQQAPAKKDLMSRPFRDKDILSEEECIEEKGLSEVVTNEGALVRRSLRKRKRNRVLNDYETGNLNQELGSEVEEKLTNNVVEQVNILAKKRTRTKGPGRPRKYPLAKDISTEGKQSALRPIQPAVEDVDTTQAFLIQMADGQTLMVQVPMSSIPVGMTLQDIAHGIANNINSTMPQQALETLENFSLNQPESIVENLPVVGNVSEFLNQQASSVPDQLQSLLLPLETPIATESSTVPMKSILLPPSAQTDIQAKICTDPLTPDFLTVPEDSVVSYSSDHTQSLNEKFPENFMDEKELASVLEEKDDPNHRVKAGIENCEQLTLNCNETEIDKSIEELNKHLKASKCFSLASAKENANKVYPCFTTGPEVQTDNLLSMPQVSVADSVNGDNHQWQTNLNIRHILFDHEYGAKSHRFDVVEAAAEVSSESSSNDAQTNNEDTSVEVADESLEDAKIDDGSCIEQNMLDLEFKNSVSSVEQTLRSNEFLQNDSSNSQKDSSDNLVVISWPEVASLLGTPSNAKVTPSESTNLAPSTSASSTMLIPLKIADKMAAILLPNKNSSEACSKGDFKTQISPELKQQLSKHASNMKFCKCCKFFCPTQEELIAHYKDNHPKCICTECNYVAEQAYIIRRHMYRHLENGYTCAICEKKYKDHYILKMHMKMVHLPADVMYQCNICQKQFNRKAHHKRHLRTHNPTKAYKCPLCTYRGCEKSDITKHMLIHEDPKHSCNVCGKIFRHIKNKELHMKRHNGQREYECSICKFKGYTYTDIRKHIERRHKNGALDSSDNLCHSCGDTFASAEHLKEHKCNNSNDSDVKVALVQNPISDAPMLSGLDEQDAENLNVDVEPTIIDVLPVTIDVPSNVAGDLNRNVLKLFESVESTNTACDISFIAS